MRTEIRRLHAPDLPALERFLAAQLEHAMFLASNLREAGLAPSEHRFAGVYVGAFVAGELVGVGSHYRMGNLILHAPQHAVEVAHAALAASARPLHTLVGPEPQIDAVLANLGLPGARSVELDEREGLYALELDALRVPEQLLRGDVRGRAAAPADLDTLVAYKVAYNVESIAIADTPELRVKLRDELPRSAAAGKLWVLEHEDQLVATTAFNAQLPTAVQIGGVYTPPPLRGRGYARCVLASHLLAAREQGVRRAILFTGDTNLPAQRAYASLGFEPIGRYRIWRPAVPLAPAARA